MGEKVLNVLRVVFIILTVLSFIGLCVGIGGLGICCAWEILYWWRIWMTVTIINTISFLASIGVVVFLFCK